MASLNSPPQNRTLGFVACGLASAFWGCGFFFGKIVLAEMNVGAMVLYRWLFACIFLLPLVWMHRRPGFTLREWLMLIFAWTLGVPVQFLLQFKGLSLTTVSHASLMIGTMPVILAIGATIFAKERLHTWGWIAIAVSTCGAAMIAFGKNPASAHGDKPTMAGDLYVVLSLVIAVFWVLINKRMMARHSALTITSWGVLSGTAMLCLIAPLLYGSPPIHHITTRAWLASLAAGLLCTAATTVLWNWGMSHAPASQVGILLNLEPLLGSLLGVLVLGDRLGTLAYIGGAMIVVAAITLTATSSSTSDTLPIEL